MQQDQNRHTSTARAHMLALGTIVVWGTTFIASTVALRTLGSQQQQFLSLDAAIAMLRAEATPPDLQ